MCVSTFLHQSNSVSLCFIDVPATSTPAMLARDKLCAVAFFAHQFLVVTGVLVTAINFVLGTRSMATFN